MNNIEELQKINKLQEEKIIALEEELEKTKEHLKKYTAPSYKKKYYENNIVNSKIFLKFFIKHNVKNFIFASTAAVYSKNSLKKKTENKYISPSSYYGKTKLEIEKYLLSYKFNFNLNIKILRFFNVVGADYKLRSGSLSKKSNQLFNSLCKSIINKDIFYIYGNNFRTRDGTCVRDFVDVNDLVKIIIFFIYSNKSTKYDIFNIGTNKGYSVLQILNLFKKNINKNIDFSILDKRIGDAVHSVCSNLRLKKIYKDKFSPIEKSIYQHYLFYKKNF
jgi:UDP-glucose 4-epimerase